MTDDNHGLTPAELLGAKSCGMTPAEYVAYKDPRVNPAEFAAEQEKAEAREQTKQAVREVLDERGSVA